MILIVGFKRDYRPDGTPVDWVHYANGPDAQHTTNWARLKDITPREGETDPQVRWRWETIGPAYEAWKAGSEIPTHGTPIAAWPGITAEQAEGLRMAGVRTVEEAAEMNDTTLGRIRLPNARALKDAARRFLDSRGAADMAERLAALEAQNAELLEAIEKPKRGRPRKEEAEAA